MPYEFTSTTLDRLLARSVLIALFTSAITSCSSSGEQAPYVGGWAGVMYEVCPTTWGRNQVDSIFIRFEPNGQVLMRRNKDGQTFTSEYTDQEDGIHVESMLGEQETWLNMEEFQRDRMMLGMEDRTCRTILELVRTRKDPAIRTRPN